MSPDATPSDGMPAHQGQAGLATACQYVTFELDGEGFAIPMAPVQEIIRVPDVARLPLAPPALVGLSNLRGRVLPILSLRHALGCESRPLDDASRALVLQLDQALGFLVDRVHSVISVEPHQMRSAAGIQSILRTDHLTHTIQVPRADGQVQLYMVLDFDNLVRREFADLETWTGKGTSLSSGHEPVHEPVSTERLVASELHLVAFAVGPEEYGIDIQTVQEIVQRPERVTEVPGAPAHVCGLMTLRDHLLPLVSLHSVFGAPPQVDEAHQRVVVVKVPGHEPLGLITDAVREVLLVSPSLVEPMPEVLRAEGQSLLFQGICKLDQGRRLLTVMDVPALVAADDWRGQAAGGLTRQEDGKDEVMAQAHQDAEDDLQVVIFRLGDEEYGVPITSVQEIVRVPDQLTRVPRTPSFVEGVINLRGTVLPVIDQRVQLGLPRLERQDRQRIMVFAHAGRKTGFIVDSVAEVMRISQHCITPAPSMSKAQEGLITRVARLEQAQRMVMLIEQEQLLLQAAGEGHRESIATATA